MIWWSYSMAFVTRIGSSHLFHFSCVFIKDFYVKVIVKIYWNLLKISLENKFYVFSNQCNCCDDVWILAYIWHSWNTSLLLADGDLDNIMLIVSRLWSTNNVTGTLVVTCVSDLWRNSSFLSLSRFLATDRCWVKSELAGHRTPGVSLAQSSRSAQLFHKIATATFTF